MREKKYWTADEVSQLRAMLDKGMTAVAIAVKLERTLHSVVGKIALIAHPKSSTSRRNTDRACMRCRAPFKSAGPGHRHCIGCRAYLTTQVEIYY